MKKYLVLLFITSLSFAQNNKQNIRGIVIDKLSQTTINGAKVQISNSEKQTITDSKGSYVLTDIAPDRYEVKVTFVGYKEVVIPNVLVTSGKEVILDITLEDEFKKLDDVIIKTSNAARLIIIPSLSSTAFVVEQEFKPLG